MAIVWIQEVFRNPGKFGLSTADLTRTLQVYSNDSVNDGPVEIAAAVSSWGIGIGSAHPKRNDAWCRNIDPRPNGDRNLGLWDVECTYSNAPVSKSEQDKILIADPTQRPWKVRGEPIREQAPCVTDRDGKAYVNPVRDPFDPPITRNRTRLQIKVEANFRETPSWYWNLTDTVNKKELYVGHKIKYLYPARTLLFCPEPLSEERLENGFDYVTLGFTLDVMQYLRILSNGEIIAEDDRILETDLFSGDVWVKPHPLRIGTPVESSEIWRRFGGWDDEQLNRGLNYLLNPAEPEATRFGPTNKTRIKDGNAHPVAVPQLLKPDGTLSANGDASYTRFGKYLLGDFEPLREMLQ